MPEVTYGPKLEGAPVISLRHYRTTGQIVPVVESEQGCYGGGDIYNPCPICNKMARSTLLRHDILWQARGLVRRIADKRFKLETVRRIVAEAALEIEATNNGACSRECRELEAARLQKELEASNG